MLGHVTNGGAWRPGQWFRRGGGWAAFCLIGLTLAGCSPTFNWRWVRPADFSLQATLPCKPQTAERPVNLGGLPAQLHMLSCDAGGLTFAVSALRLPPGASSVAVLQSWKQASLLSLKLTPEQAQAWSPQARLGGEVSGWQANGTRHDGSAVKAHVLMLARGPEVFQVAVYGPATPAVLAELIDGLKLDAAP